MHAVAKEPASCGECRVFNIVGRLAYESYAKGESVRGECRRFAPCLNRYLPLFPEVWSGDPACGDALGALDGEPMGPIA